ELDRLFYDSYVARDDRPLPVTIAGGDSPASAEGAAAAALLAGDATAALAAVQRSSAPTAYLRLLSGDARWRRRQLHGALAEYGDGLALAPAPEHAAVLQQRRTLLLDELRPYDDAAQATGRNGWLAAAAVLALLAAGWWAGRRG